MHRVAEVGEPWWRGRKKCCLPWTVATSIIDSTCPFGKRAGRVGDISCRLTGDDDVHEVLLGRSPDPPATAC
jgi:hypothetical protein